MDNFTFLDQLAHYILNNKDIEFNDLVIVLPNKRAKVFLINAIQLQSETNLLSPEIISIEDFIEDVSGITQIDSIEVLFQFYTVYCNVTEKINQQPFDMFANWAKTLLQDFNEIDRYLLDSNHVLSYIKDIEDIKRWGISLEEKTPLLEKYVDFWKLLPNYYDSLYQHLLAQEIGYQGLMYREAVNKIAQFAFEHSNKKYIFGGFNALNAAEEKIIQYLLANNQAKIFWDVDSIFLKDQQHDAGLFTRRYLQNWSYYKTHSWDWVLNTFSLSKKIEIIGTPKSIGQAKIVGGIIEESLKSNPKASIENTAIILGDENLLLPILYSLPSQVDALNITMGFSSKSNPTQQLIFKLFKLHSNAVKRSGATYTFYYKDILDILSHPLIETYVNAANLVNTIVTNNYTFVTSKKLQDLHPDSNDLFNLLFKPWNSDIATVLADINKLLLHLKENLSADIKEDAIAKAFLFSVYKVINKIISFQNNYAYIDSVATLFTVYKLLIEMAEVTFEGEPLSGLQIMGVLESRVLDFETVIITSLNEGKFPAGKSQNSFIPYDVKKELGLPTFKEKDAIYTYHFYHMLQRAKNIYLVYNTESEGFDAGEKSRFITQLEIEKQPNHTISHQILTVPLPEIPLQLLTIPKSEMVMDRLKVISEVGFSPSALTSYIRNPIDFYYQKILRIRETEEVEEKIALNTLGTIIHRALEDLYSKHIGVELTEDIIKGMISKINPIVTEKFKEVYKEGEIKKGRNYLAFEVAKRNVSNFLKEELKSIQNGDVITILNLEYNLQYTLTHPKLPHPITLRGNADRIELRNNVLRIIDYKTGKVESKQMVLSSWGGLTQEINKDKIIQVLIYALMYRQKNQTLEVGIVSFKNLKAGFMPFTFKQDKTLTTIINEELMSNFIEELVLLLNEIFDPSIPFTERKD